MAPDEPWWAPACHIADALERAIATGRTLDGPPRGMRNQTTASEYVAAIRKAVAARRASDLLFALEALTYAYWLYRGFAKPHELMGAIHACANAAEMEQAGSSLRAPIYSSWSDFRTRHDPIALRRWCQEKAATANKRAARRGVAGRITAEDVWAVLATARGRCAYCHSLALEHRPSVVRLGKRENWRPVGRRIGSLEHQDRLADHGANAPANLIWCCLRCNTSITGEAHVPEAADFGGLYPQESEDAAPDSLTPPWPVPTRRSYDEDLDDDVELADAYGFVEEDDPWGRDWL